MKLLLTIGLILSGLIAKAQIKDSLIFLPGIKVNNDTIAQIELPTVYVFSPMKFKSKRMEDQYWRLVNKVKKVYPFAKKAASLMKEYDIRYRATEDKKLRRQYIRSAEEELFKTYGPQLKKLTISEGRILIKLIDRETGTTSYELIKELKGGITAFFWQGVAKIFGNDLKSHYDALNEDRVIEQIVYYIDVGII